jgi:hypothetical protein
VFVVASTSLALEAHVAALRTLETILIPLFQTENADGRNDQ